VSPTEDRNTCHGERVCYAAGAVSFLSPSTAALTTDSRSGLSVTTAIGCQLRVCLAQRLDWLHGLGLLNGERRDKLWRTKRIVPMNRYDRTAYRKLPVFTLRACQCV